MIPSKKQKSIIGIEIILLNILLWFFIYFFVSTRYYYNEYTIAGILFILAYGLAGIYFGFHWPDYSWRWAIWITMPLLFGMTGIIILRLSENVQFSSPAVLMFLLPYGIMMFFSSIGNHTNIEIIQSGDMFLYIIYLLFTVSTFIGAYFGANVFLRAEAYWVRSILALGVGSIMAIILPPFEYFIGFIYFFIALVFGKYWPEFSWRWGILITLSSLIYLITYILVKSDQSHVNKVDSQGILISGLVCLILGCIGAYIGAYRKKTSSGI